MVHSAFGGVEQKVENSCTVSRLSTFWSHSDQSNLVHKKYNAVYREFVWFFSFTFLTSCLRSTRSSAVKSCEMYTFLNLGVYLRNFCRFKKAWTTSGELKDTRTGRGLATISLVFPVSSSKWVFHRKRPWRHPHCSQLSHQGHRKRHSLNRTEIRGVGTGVAGGATAPPII